MERVYGGGREGVEAVWVFGRLDPMYGALEFFYFQSKQVVAMG